jgi:hypothetical protein
MPIVELMSYVASGRKVGVNEVGEEETLACLWRGLFSFVADPTLSLY